MLETYQGILRDNRIEWSGDSPKRLSPDHAVRVHITILEDVGTSAPEQGRRMAAALERLAASGAPSSIPDLLDWEREMHEAHHLTGGDGW
jgi:hypothetical protein